MLTERRMVELDGGAEPSWPEMAWALATTVVAVIGSGALLALVVWR